jgi:hypothetical protein
LRIPESKIRLAKQVDLGVIGYPNTMDPKSSFLRQNNSTSALNHEVQIKYIRTCEEPTVHSFI